MTNIFDNADTFLNANSDLFDGLSENDLLIPEKLIFVKNEVIQATVVDVTQVEKLGAIKLEVKIETGDHASKLHECLVFKPKPNEKGEISPTSKKNWVEFLLAFFTKEEILSKNVNLQKLVGQKIEFKAGEAKAKGDKTYQNYNSYKLVTEQAPF